MPVQAFGASEFGLRGARDSHGGRSDECLSRSCIAHRGRHYAADSNTHNPLTPREARGADASFKLKVRERTRRTKVRNSKQGANPRVEQIQRPSCYARARNTQGPYFSMESSAHVDPPMPLPAEAHGRHFKHHATPRVRKSHHRAAGTQPQ